MYLEVHLSHATDHSVSLEVNYAVLSRSSSHIDVLGSTLGRDQMAQSFMVLSKDKLRQGTALTHGILIVCG